MPAVAHVENGRALIGATQLLCVETHFLPAALLAHLIDDGIRLHVRVVDGLHFGALGAQRRRESLGLGAGHDRLGRAVCSGMSVVLLVSPQVP